MLQSPGSQRVGCGWATEQQQHTGPSSPWGWFLFFTESRQRNLNHVVSVVSCCRRDGPRDSNYCLHSTKKKLTDSNVCLFFTQAISEIGFTLYWLASIHLSRKSQQRRHCENCIRGCVGIAERWGQPRHLQAKRTSWKYKARRGHQPHTLETRTWVGAQQLVRTGFLLKALPLSTPKWMGRAISAACPEGDANWPRTYLWSVDRRGRLRV